MGFVYPRNVRFHCARCTLCCGDTRTKTRHILLLRKETERVSEVTSKPIEAFACMIRGHGPYVYEMKKTEEGKCLFLDGKTCRIYESRPLICRCYPFQLRTLRNGKHVFSFSEECPSIGFGMTLEKSYFEGLFKRAHCLLGRI